VLTREMIPGLALALRPFARRVLAGARPLGLTYEQVEGHVLAALAAGRDGGVT